MINKNTAHPLTTSSQANTQNFRYNQPTDNQIVSASGPSRGDEPELTPGVLIETSVAIRIRLKTLNQKHNFIIADLDDHHLFVHEDKMDLIRQEIQNFQDEKNRQDEKNKEDEINKRK